MSGTTPSWSHANVVPERPRPGLDLVGDHQHVGLVAQRAHLAEEALRRHDHAALALDRLEQHGDRRLVDRGADRGDVAVRHHPEARRVRRVAGRRVGVVAEADDRGRAAVEVALHHDDRGLRLGDALDVVAPAAADLDRGLDGLGAGVHRQDQVLAGELGEGLRERAELVVEERPAGQRQLVDLLVHAGQQARVAVAEVQGGVPGQAVEVTLPVDVGDPRALAGREHHRQRMVVVRGVGLGELDVLLGAAADGATGHGCILAQEGPGFQNIVRQFWRVLASLGSRAWRRHPRPTTSARRWRTYSPAYAATSRPWSASSR